MTNKVKVYRIIGIAAVFIAIALEVTSLILNLISWSDAVWVLYALPTIGMGFLVLGLVMLILMVIAQKKKD